ncbi:3-isopropylmalate dehydratase small subunit [Streptomyces sp. NPDC051366]|uniref:3-isopropylmalate dehydratase small subunit n=1 Tax=unclassified Streptomyces TaxID=2593676 RepID=UPI00224E4AB7|nr:MULTISPECIES: 3-isopropylmalate dehydratase small subunit [unclassified Streptomyces]MCX4627020.1 3-isopropylmalate dehydratase small subunit [Streptomyces sp. NBC_01443]WSW43176.1 3-isopropylmalate dehydratase small subunit [Streptomyces sp. NBC_01001]
MEKFTVHTGTALPLRRSNVDTDQIIPARYVPYFSKTGHANALFADWRDDPEFALNLPQYQGATVLIAGNEFGTGSSRESAVWALQKFGFRVVLAPRFGDIFRGNSLMKGLLTVECPVETIEYLWQQVETDASVPVVVDLEECEVRCGKVVQPFTLTDAARQRLLEGLDPIDVTLQYEDDIAGYERARRRSLPVTF